MLQPCSLSSGPWGHGRPVGPVVGSVERVPKSEVRTVQYLVHLEENEGRPNRNPRGARRTRSSDPPPIAIIGAIAGKANSRRARGENDVTKNQIRFVSALSHIPYSCTRRSRLGANAERWELYCATVANSPQLPSRHSRFRCRLSSARHEIPYHGSNPARPARSQGSHFSLCV